MTTEVFAKQLFETYRHALPDAGIKVTWYELPREMVRAWKVVAEEARRIVEDELG